MKYAPIVVFAYNRADKLADLFASLEKNADIDKMDLYIFVDVPDKKNKKDIRYNAEVQEYVNKYSAISGAFRNISVEIAVDHKGLADSIISGVTKVINKYGKVIVLEDDLIVSNDFLDYMQRGLEYYKNDKRIWSIGAHCPSLNSLNTYKADVFMIPRAESLGWGTWLNRWNHMDWEVKSYDKFQNDFVGQMIFNLGGNDLSNALKKQMTDETYDSWAIRWSYQQFRERKYTILPKESRVVHCGNDNRSTHGVYYSTQSLRNVYKKSVFEPVVPNYRVMWEFRKRNSVSFMKRWRERNNHKF